MMNGAVLFYFQEHTIQKEEIYMYESNRTSHGKKNPTLSSTE